MNPLQTTRDPYIVAICRESVWEITRFPELSQATAYADHYGMQWSLVYVFRILTDIDPTDSRQNRGPFLGSQQFAVITTINGTEDITLAYDLQEARNYYDLRIEHNLNPQIVQAISGPEKHSQLPRLDIIHDSAI